jgi:ubiquinone/menaquinone biosynthesis C-methylase UbiE
LRAFDRSLELGAGTGYFSLNLLQAGVITDATCTDISQGMVDTLAANAQRLGLQVDARIADAEALPFDDDSFDLVLGHAVLHHLPDLDQAWREILRVLRPGGVAVFAGEPSHYGDRIASVPKRAASRAAPAWRRVMRARPAQEGHQDGGAVNHQLESMVDVHAFTPEQLSAGARAAGFADVRVRGEELLANWFGWANRALEASADPETVPWAWKMYAFRGYIGLQHVDRVLLEPRLPPAMFYNLMITAEKAPA